MKESTLKENSICQKRVPFNQFAHLEETFIALPRQVAECRSTLIG